MSSASSTCPCAYTPDFPYKSEVLEAPGGYTDDRNGTSVLKAVNTTIRLTTPGALRDAVTIGIPNHLQYPRMATHDVLLGYARLPGRREIMSLPKLNLQESRLGGKILSDLVGDVAWLPAVAT